jgi:hypothetical protein
MIESKKPCHSMQGFMKVIRSGKDNLTTARNGKISIGLIGIQPVMSFLMLTYF